MGRGKKLTDSEIQTVLSLSRENSSVSEIARAINKSRKVIIDLLKKSKKLREKETLWTTCSSRNTRETCHYKSSIKSAASLTASLWDKNEY